MQADLNENYSVYDFANGFVHGLQKYENQTSKCSTDVIKVKGIINDFNDIVEQIWDGKFDIAHISFFIYSTWATLNSIEASCHFYDFFIELKELMDPIKLILRIDYIIFIASFTNVPAFFRMIYSTIFGDWYTSGLMLGRMIKVSFQYYIE